MKKAERRRIDAFELWCWFRPSEAAQQNAEAQQNEYNYQSTPENYDASMFDDQMPEDIPF